MMPFYILASDIADPKRLRHVARLCERFGTRLQKSVFMLDIEPPELAKLQGRIASLIDHQEDTVRYYPLTIRDMTYAKSIGVAIEGLIPSTHWII